MRDSMENGGRVAAIAVPLIVSALFVAAFLLPPYSSSLGGGGGAAESASIREHFLRHVPQKPSRTPPVPSAQLAGKVRTRRVFKRNAASRKSRNTLRDIYIYIVVPLAFDRSYVCIR